MRITKQKALEHLQQMNKENHEVSDFAFRKNRLDLFRASELEGAVLYEAIVALQESITRDNAQALPVDSERP